MRNTVAKKLRKAATTGAYKFLDRDLVMGRHSVVNSPQSVRALYLRLKKAWKNLGGSNPAPLVERERKASGFHRPADLHAGYALIESPLKQLKALYPGTTLPSGVYVESRIASTANYFAKRGWGSSLKFLANFHL